MSAARANVLPGQPIFLAVSYDAEGNAIDSAGPYTTRGSAAAQVRRLLRFAWRRAVIARVVVSTPAWTPVDRTEVRS